MAAKTTQPLFCTGPGLVVLYYLIRSRPDARAIVPSRRYTIATLAIGSPWIIGTVAWYIRNLTPAMQLARSGAFAPATSKFWGKNDTYVNTIRY